MIFIEIQNLQELEKEHKWKQVISLLQNNWCQDRNNIDIMLRLATECWYILSNWDILDLESSYLEFDSIQSILIETYHYFLNTHSKDDKCLSIFGYMMSLFPNYFYDGHDKTGKMFFEYENQGKDMLKLAYRNEPENMFYKALYLGATSKLSKLIESTKKELRYILPNLFPNNTEIEKYFREVLSK